MSSRVHTLAIRSYRSLRDVRLPMGTLNLVTGPNGSGKSSLYRALRLLSETAFGTATASLAREGGLDSVLWAGPETISRGMKRGSVPVQGTRRKGVIRLLLGFATDDFGYAIDFGLPVASSPGPTLFQRDPEIKREVIWARSVFHERRATVDRRGGMLRARDEQGAWQVVDDQVPAFDSMLSRLADPRLVPEAVLLREQIRSWRFYDHFRTDRDSPARQPQIGTRTPVLGHDGRDVAAAWQTIVEIGDALALDAAVEDAFPGGRVTVDNRDGRFELLFGQPGLLRPLAQSELSDGTLRYLLWIAALLSPRPPSMMVLNEPETSLHPDLLPALGRLMARCAEDTQLWVITHSTALAEALAREPGCVALPIDKELGETVLVGRGPLDQPAWTWPKR